MLKKMVLLTFKKKVFMHCLYFFGKCLQFLVEESAESQVSIVGNCQKSLEIVCLKNVKNVGIGVMGFGLCERVLFLSFVLRGGYLGWVLTVMYKVPEPRGR